MKLNKIIPKNKKGSTFEGWTEGIIFSTLIVILFATIILPGMNTKHNQSYQIEGLNTTGVINNFNTYQTNQQDKLTNADPSFLSAVGLTISTSWDILVGVLTMVMFFVTGGWIETIFSYLLVPAIVGQIIRGLFVLALGFIMLRVLLKERI